MKYETWIFLKWFLSSNVTSDLGSDLHVDVILTSLSQKIGDTRPGYQVWENDQTMFYLAVCDELYDVDVYEKNTGYRQKYVQDFFEMSSNVLEMLEIIENCLLVHFSDMLILFEFNRYAF